MTFRFDKLTNKAQGLVAEAQGRAAALAIRKSFRCICLRPCWTSPMGLQGHCSKR